MNKDLKSVDILKEFKIIKNKSDIQGPYFRHLPEK